jgi:hypothetical protein
MFAIILLYGHYGVDAEASVFDQWFQTGSPYAIAFYLTLIRMTKNEKYLAVFKRLMLFNVLSQKTT